MQPQRFRKNIVPNELYFSRLGNPVEQPEHRQASAISSATDNTLKYCLLDLVTTSALGVQEGFWQE